MRLTTTLAAAAAIAVSGVAANAGGLAPAVPEMTVAPVMVDTPAPAGSINSGYVVLGLLAALVAASGSF
tara:strand:- start:23231 stop:23437 length:207 start_codon:yes stop_codon:yes gene_type:complete